MAAVREPRRTWILAVVLVAASGLGFTMPRSKTPEGPPVARRHLAVAFPTALLALSEKSGAEGDVEMPSGVLKAVSGVVTGLLKPIYKIEAPLQAGSYDKAAVQARIQREITSAPVVFYSYSLSPFCTQTKDFLESLGAKYQEVVLGPEWIPGLLDAEGAAVRAELGEMTGQTSMPHVFIGGKSVGGLFSGTPGLVPLQEAGELQSKLKDAGAL